MIPYWYLVVAVMATAPMAWLVGRGRLRDERRLRQEAEAQARAGKFAIGRARAQQVAADALLRALPQPMSPPDLADAYDTEPEPVDEPERPQGWQIGPADRDENDQGDASNEDPPPPAGTHRWAGAKADPELRRVAQLGVKPNPRLATNARTLFDGPWLRYWLRRSRPVWSRLRLYVSQRWGFAPLDPSPGWLTAGDRQVWFDDPPQISALQPDPAPARQPIRPSRPAAHLWERGKVSARALLDDWAPCGDGGRHRAGSAPGALGQRQARLLALPRGAA